MTMLQIRHIESALHKAILEMDTSKDILSVFHFKLAQLGQAKDKNEWIDYGSFIPWKYLRYILYEFFCEEAKFLLMLEN